MREIWAGNENPAQRGIPCSKTHDRTYDGSMRLLEKSLKNLQTDHLDLWQIHNVKGSEIGNLDKFFAADGVVKAMEKAGMKRW